MGKALGWAVLAEAGGSLSRPRQAMAPAILCGQRAPGQSAEGETSAGGVPPTGHVTSPVPPPPGSLPWSPWRGGARPQLLAQPCRVTITHLGGLSPWRPGTVCRPWLCVRWGALHGSESWSLTEKRVREPKEVGSAGRGERSRGPALPWRTSSGTHGHTPRWGGRGQSGSRFPALTRRPRFLVERRDLLPPCFSSIFSAPVLAGRLSLPVMLRWGQRGSGPIFALFPWKLVGSTSAPARLEGSPRKRPPRMTSA